MDNKKISTQTIARAIMTLIVAVNIVLKSIGADGFSTDGSAFAVIEAVTEVAVIALGFWKNNSFTKAAITADEYLDEIRNGEYGADTMTLDEFCSCHKDGRSYDWQGTYKGECVSLVKRYISAVLGITPLSIGNAKEYWLKRGLKYISDNFTPIASGKAQRGDIFVRTSGTYGHVGIVLTADDKGFTTIEQNKGGCRAVTHEKMAYAQEVHFLRPKNQKNIKPTPRSAVNPVIKVNATMLRNADVYKDNTALIRIGSVQKNERVRCLAHGKITSIIQYATSATTYAAGCIPSAYISIDK